MEKFKEQLEQLVEPLARQFAAEKMNLQKDPLGEKLPEDLWRQTVPQARKFLNLERCA
jgi:hypothetical protein